MFNFGEHSKNKLVLIITYTIPIPSLPLQGNAACHSGITEHEVLLNDCYKELTLWNPSINVK